MYFYKKRNFLKPHHIQQIINNKVIPYSLGSLPKKGKINKNPSKHSASPNKDYRKGAAIMQNTEPPKQTKAPHIQPCQDKHSRNTD